MKIQRVLSVLAAAIFVLSPRLGASVLYTTLPFTPSGPGYLTADTAGFAVSFSVPQTATLGSVTLGLQDASLDTIVETVSLFTNNGGAPGSLIENLGATGALAPLAADYTLGSTSQPTLQAGVTYWLVAFSSGTDPGNDRGDWLFSSSGASTTVEVAQGSDTSFTIADSFADTVPAFEIDGTISAPEPATLALAGLGLIGLGCVRRRNERESKQAGAARGAKIKA